MSLVLQAVEMAIRAHDGQKRSGSGEPFVLHPIRVAHILTDVGANEVVVAAAVLHDAVEDTSLTNDDVKAFDARVASIVSEVTDDPTLDKLARKRRQVEKARTGWYSRPASLIKMADKLDNVRSLSESPPAWSAASILGYATGCRDLVEALRHNGPQHTQLGRLFDEAYAKVVA